MSNKHTKDSDRYEDDGELTNIQKRKSRLDMKKLNKKLYNFTSESFEDYNRCGEYCGISANGHKLANIRDNFNQGFSDQVYGISIFNIEDMFEDFDWDDFED